MTTLRELRLYNNRLTDLPESIGALSNLRELHLSNNQLAALPHSVGRLRSLRELRLQDNRVSTLPPGASPSSRCTLGDRSRKPAISARTRCGSTGSSS